ncbi:MAG: hypothetical protein FWE05_11045 [Defluviitaleaceae bacterium]|nr:hypothetical protein [Defluviitaleaceae bacterium]
MATPRKIACSPKIGDYHILTNMLVERCLGYETMLVPPMTKRTLELGARHSPDMICTPFKKIMGSFIEAAEMGANVFIMPGAGCRLGFYDVLQKQILSDLGYDCELFVLFDYFPTATRLFKALKEVNKDLTQDAFDTVFYTAAQIAFDMDSLSDFMRRHMGFEVTKGTFEKYYDAYLKEAPLAQNADEAKAIGLKHKEKLESIPINKPKKPVRIGMVGEIYDLVEPFSNCYIEKWLAEHAVEIVRPFGLTSMPDVIFNVENAIAKSGGYVDYNIGSTANEVIAQAYQMMNDKIDGIIHVKPASCSPEITAMAILQNMAQDHETPIMYLTFDTETGEAGVHTRLEAFYDMIVMKGAF